MTLPIVGEWSGFCRIRCRFGVCHFPRGELENGQQILCNLPKWGLLNYFGGIHGFLGYIVNSANGADFATFIF